MKEFIIENMEVIITFITMIITWVFGKIIKKHTDLSNKLIPIQNMVIMVLATLIYYYATGNISMTIASGSPIATLLYDMVHTMKKDSYEEYEDAGADLDE